MKVLAAQSCTTLHDPVNRGARQSPLAIESSKQEYWTGLPFPPPGDLPNPAIEPRCPALQADSLSTEPQGSPGLHKMLVISPVSCDSFRTVTSSFKLYVQPTLHFCGIQTWGCPGPWGAGCGWQQSPIPRWRLNLG